MQVCDDAGPSPSLPGEDPGHPRHQDRRLTSMTERPRIPGSGGLRFASRSTPVVGVDRDVVVRQVTGPDRGGAAADADVDTDDDFAVFHVGRDGLLDVLVGTLAIAGDDVVTEPD